MGICISDYLKLKTIEQIWTQFFAKLSALSGEGLKLLKSFEATITLKNWFLNILDTKIKLFLSICQLLYLS